MLIAAPCLLDVASATETDCRAECNAGSHEASESRDQNLDRT